MSEQIKMEDRDYLAYTLGALHMVEKKVNEKWFKKGAKLMKGLVD